jgi:hypothetical protein
MRTGLAWPRKSFWTAYAGIFLGLASALVILAGIAAWLILPEPSDAGDDVDATYTPVIDTALNASTEAKPHQAVVKRPPAPSATAATADEPATVGAPIAPQVTKDAEVKPPEPLDRLKIASQSWQRGGLGSKALVTMTLRNANDFAVKDIEIACVFIRRDGSHVTDRTRVIPDTIAMRSRKTYSRMLIGFVNISASKAKCSVVTASRL